MSQRVQQIVSTDQRKHGYLPHHHQSREAKRCGRIPPSDISVFVCEHTALHLLTVHIIKKKQGSDASTPPTEASYTYMEQIRISPTIRPVDQVNLNLKFPPPGRDYLLYTRMKAQRRIQVAIPREPFYGFRKAVLNNATWARCPPTPPSARPNNRHPNNRHPTNRQHLLWAEAIRSNQLAQNHTLFLVLTPFTAQNHNVRP